MTQDSLLDRQTNPESSLRPEGERRALGGIGTAGPFGLYETSTGSAENVRLADMAERFGDLASLEALERLGVRRGEIVLDIGCGNSVSLANKMSGLGFEIIPTDIRPDAVAAHQLAGFSNARESGANCLMAGDNMVDALHARFTWGWLSPQERVASLAEMFRVGRKDGTGMGIAIIDYDWSVCEGPEEFKDAMTVITDLLQEQGFDPDFGGKLPVLFGQYLNAVGAEPDEVMIQRSPTYGGTILGAWKDIFATAQPIIEGLAKIGQDEKIRAELEKLRCFVDANPGAHVRLPDLVAMTAKFTEKNNHNLTQEYFELGKISSLRRAVAAPGPELYPGGVDFVDVLGSGTSGIVVSENLRKRLRRTQALAYLDAGIVTRDAISPEGVLVEGNDPQELIDRSDYFLSLDEACSRIGGQARSIRPNGNGVESLPFVQRTLEHSPGSRALLESEGIFDPNKNVIEISGIAKNPIGGSFLNVIEAVVALSKYNAQNGVDIAVMSIDEKQASLMRRLFGEKNLRQFGDDSFVHSIRLPGVNNERRFVPLITNNDFLQLAEIHLKRLVSIAERRGEPSQFYNDVLSLMSSS